MPSSPDNRIASSSAIAQPDPRSRGVAQRSSLSWALSRIQAILDSNVFKVLFAASVFTAALVSLRRELDETSLQSVRTAIGETSPTALLLAIATTLASYACLGVSEWWALRVIGRRLSATRIGLVTFVSYALSNGLGFSVATGAAARVRLYSSWGLGGGEAASVSVLAGLAVTFSGFVTAGAALLLIPALSAGRAALSLLLLVPSLLWFAPLPRHVWFLPGVSLRAPDALRRAGALGGGVLDWVFSALALFVLLPQPSAADFLPFLAIFVLGSIVSAISGIPGGIGVFDAIVLTLSRQFSVVHETAAALVVYRLVYAMGPLLITAAGLCVVQLRRVLSATVQSEIRGVAGALAPSVLAVLTFYLGAALLLAATGSPVHLATPSAVAVDFPRSPLSSSVVGMLMLVLASALWRRQEGAYLAALALLLCGAVAEFWRGFGWVSAGPLIIVSLLIVPWRFAFDRRSALIRDPPSPGWMAAIALSGLSAWVLATVGGQGLGEPSSSLGARIERVGALNTVAVVACVALVAAFWRLLGPARHATAGPSSQDLARARQVISRTGAVHCDAFLALMGDKAFVFSPSGQSFVMYGRRGGRWIAMGDPAGPSSDRAAAISAFVDAADDAGVTPAFYAVEEESLSDLVAAGFIPFKIGESASVVVRDFDLNGAAMEDLRHARNRADRLGESLRIYQADEPDIPWEELQAVSSAWLAIHAGSEKGFSLGAFDLDYLRNFPIAVLRDASRVLAFANIVASPDRSRFSIDLMRSRPDAPHGAMDAMFVKLISWGRDEGYGSFELGMAPLAGSDAAALDTWFRRIERWIYHAGEKVYGFEGLRAYKQKFHPQWRPMFLAAPPGVHPLSVLADTALLTSKGARGLAHRPRRRPNAASSLRS